MSNYQEDLDLLLSLQDRVLETPPGSPTNLHPHSPGYLSDNEFSKRSRQVDMSIFKNAVQDCLDFEPKTVKKSPKSKHFTKSNDPEIEKFSGLRIRNLLVSAGELSNQFSDIRFVRLTAIRNLLLGDTLSGCWATVGVLAEKSNAKTSSTGKNYCIWKIGCLDEMTISIFLFGDAYQQHWKEQAGTVFTFFNSGVRKDASGSGFSLSAYSANQVLKLGTSIDYGVCKGKRKDGMACTLVINKRHGIYCSYHKSKTFEKYSVVRNELKGGNLRTAFKEPYKREGIYMVDPLADRTSSKKPKQPLKVLSVEGLRRALSGADKVTTNTHSQGIRFLREITGKTDLMDIKKGTAVPHQQMATAKKRLSSMKTFNSQLLSRNLQSNVKRKKCEEEQAAAGTNKGTEKMIELDILSSDEEL